MRRFIALSLCVGCSLVNDPSNHQEPGDTGRVDTGTDARGLDSAREDAEPADVGPGDTGPADGASDVMSPDVPDGGPMSDVVDAGLRDVFDSGPPPDVFDAGPLPSFTIAEYCGEYGRLMCEAQVRCCSIIDDAAECEDFEDFCLLFFDPLPSILDYNGETAFAAIATLETLTAACSQELPEWGAAEFFSPLEGTLGEGEACVAPGFNAVAIVHSALVCDRSSTVRVCQADSAIDGTWQCGVLKPDNELCGYGFMCRSERCSRNPIFDRCSRGYGLGETCGVGRPDQCASLLCRPVGGEYECVDRTDDNVYCDQIADP